MKQIVEKCIFFKNLDKFFGKIIKTEWVTGKEIDEQREAEIQSCFSNNVEFHFIAEPDELTSLI